MVVELAILPPAGADYFQVVRVTKQDLRRVILGLGLGFEVGSWLRSGSMARVILGHSMIGLDYL